MSDHKEQVRTFYDVVWNAHNKNAIAEVLHATIRFRGSLGQSTMGHAGFAEYLDRVHSALDDYPCDIEALVSEPPKVFAKMTFPGTHQGDFLGYPPTGKRLTWAGAALFTFDQDKIIDLWVLAISSPLKPSSSRMKHNRHSDGLPFGSGHP